MSLFNELKRRNVIRVGLAYVVTAWVIAQVASLVFDSVKAPDWVMQVLLLGLGLGLIVALIIAWAYELTPEGIKKEKDVVRDDSVTNITAKKLDYITLAGVLLVVALFIYQQMNPTTLREIPTLEETQSEVATTDSRLRGNDENSVGNDEIVEDEISDKSIAVLPFVNMSDDKSQEYFADGISEEILNALVKATGLHVAGRTSSFSFKGKDATIKHIGEALNVAYVLEGSVRKQRNNVRITAQLIKANDGFHLWSETYDGDLDNIFDLQEDISRKVTEALKLILKIGDKQRLANNMTDNIEAYDFFLRGREKVRKRIGNNIPEGIVLLEQAVALDPNFAEAWAKLAEAEAVSHGYIPVSGEELATERALSHIQQAIEINENLALPYAVKGLISLDRSDFLSAIEYFSNALKLEPNNSIAIRWLGNAYAMLGLEKMSQPLFEQAYALDPLSSIDTYNLGALHFKLENLEQAIRYFNISSEIRSFLIDTPAFIYDYQGQTQKAIDYMLESHQNVVNRNGPQFIFSREQAEVRALGLFSGTEDQKEAARNIGFMNINSAVINFPWQLKYLLALDDMDRVFELLESKPYMFSNFAADEMWIPLESMKKFRSDPRFIKLLVKHNLPVAWQKLGWPKYCQPNAGTDGSNGQFQCQ